LGIFVSSVINFATERLMSPASWRITMGFDFLWVSLLAFGLFFLPESPKYVFQTGQPDRARAIMARLLGVEEDHQIVQREMRDMETTSTKQSHKGERWWQPFRSRSVCARTLLAAGVLSFQQLTGVNLFFYYGTSIFAATGISNGYAIQMIISAVNVVCTIPGLYFAQNFSHRRCLVLGALWMAVCFTVYASVGHFGLEKDDPSQTPTAGAVMIASTALFIAAFATTWGPLSWGEATAVCPANCRATCASIATAVFWVWSFLLAFFTPTITAQIDYLYGYVFGGCCILAALMVQAFLLESRGRTLEEIDSMYSERLGGARDEGPGPTTRQCGD
jgi:SP family sugar:H+ symporter-like MFS transporter